MIRYYLNYGNDEDLARGLLMLFLPFRYEMEEIHTQDVKQILFENSNIVEDKRKMFEKYKVMTDLISNIQTQSNQEDNHEDNQEEKNWSRYRNNNS